VQRPTSTRRMRKSVDHPAFALLLQMLKDARLKAGLTQQEVADALQEPQSFVAKYEGGERRLDVIELISIAKVLRTDPCVIVRALARIV
jgi:transcriptional regulator with XRE-family HTH domain